MSMMTGPHVHLARLVMDLIDERVELGLHARQIGTQPGKATMEPGRVTRRRDPTAKVLCAQSSAL